MARPSPQARNPAPARTSTRPSIPEVNPDDLLRVHFGQQLPKRLALDARVEVPYGIDECPRRQMDDTLFRPQPAELRVRRKLPVKPAKVVRDGRQIAPYNKTREIAKSVGAQLRAAP